METKRKLRAEVIQLTYRVKELEERLCPCEQHDLVKIGSRTIASKFDVDIIDQLKCRRCGKIIERY